MRERADLTGGPLVVALSGGADSSALAWVAAMSSKSTRAVYVDHGLAASNDLRAAAKRVAAVLGIELDVVDAPVDRTSPSFEDVARRSRYAALLGAAAADETVLTGHTADDQAETVLGHFLRGAGAPGLAGIPKHRGRVRRPLLSVTRAETRALADELGLPFLDDPENQSLDLRRNRLRAELIPHLESDYNPQLRAGLLRTASLMAADDEALEALAVRIRLLDDGEAVGLPASALRVVPHAVATRAVRRALRQLRGPHGGSHGEVTAVLDVAARTRRGAQLSEGLRVEREGPMVVVSKRPAAPAAEVSVEAPGEVSFDRWRLRFRVSGGAPRPRSLGARALIGDADTVGSDLLIRPMTGADRIELGAGTKMVADALAEGGVPRRLRSRWPVVVSGDRVAFVPGVRSAAWVWPSRVTVRYLETLIEAAAGGD